MCSKMSNFAIIFRQEDCKRRPVTAGIVLKCLAIKVYYVFQQRVGETVGFSYDTGGADVLREFTFLSSPAM